jgi:hypothetical protein
MHKSHWFWNSGLMDVVEKQLLNLTHWVWAKRNESSEIEYIPKIEPKLVTPPEESNNAVAEPAKPVKKPAAKRTPKAPKGNEWNVKGPAK